VRVKLYTKLYNVGTKNCYMIIGTFWLNYLYKTMLHNIPDLINGVYLTTNCTLGGNQYYILCKKNLFCLNKINLR